MPFTAFFEGKNASITISATARTYDRMDLRFRSEVIETSNFTSSGYQSNRSGFRQCDSTFEGPYDGSTGFSDGDSVSIIFAAGGGGPSFTITQRVSDIGLSTAARNQVMREQVTATSNGVFSVTI